MTEPRRPLRSILLTLASVATLAAVVVPPATATAEPATEISQLSRDKRAQLKDHIRKGTTAYDNGNFERSLAEFQQALDILEHPDFVYRIALAHDRLDHVRPALEAYRRFLRMAPDSDDRGKVERTIRQLEKRLKQTKPTLEISTTPPGAEVLLDDESAPRGVSQLTLTTSTGKHVVTLRKDGFETVRRTVELENGQTLAMQVELDEIPGGNSTVDSPPRTDGGSAPIGPIITLSSAGLLAVGSVVSFTRFSYYRGRVEEQQSCRPNCAEQDSYQDNVDSQVTWERTTWTLGGIAAGAAGVGAVWLAIHGNNAGDKTARRPLRLAPMVGPNRVGLQLRLTP